MDDYSNREIDSMVRELTKEIVEVKTDVLTVVDAYMTQDKMAHDSTKESLAEIKGMVKYTNGRVRWLEKMVWLAIGAIPILGFNAYFLWRQVYGIHDEIKADLKQTIDETFTNITPVK